MLATAATGTTGLITSIAGPATAGPAFAAGPTTAVTAYIDDRAISPVALMRWESRRIRVASERLRDSLPAAVTAELALIRPTDDDLAELPRRRALLAEAKLRAGENQMRALLAPDVAATEKLSRAATTGGQWSVSTADIVCTRGTGAGFLDWFDSRSDRNDERAMLIACPDHYLIRSPRPRVQEVIEVTGGAVLGTRFLIDYRDRTDLPIRRSNDFPLETAGWASTEEGGPRIGAVRHQLRDERGGGFRARLAVAFPATLPPTMIAEHRWHLACEFSNWVSSYLGAT
jgi:hypothetical protein